MGQHVSRTKFHTSYTDEPHATRRREILQVHPEIKQLFGIEPAFKYVVLAMVITQTIIAICLKDSAWPLIVLQAYLAGGTFNHALTLAIHDISHFMAFGLRYPIANRLFGMIANLPLGVAMSVSFKKYHVEHHRYLGVYAIDTDVPTDFEAKTFNTTFGKALWMFLQPFFYAFRPLLIYNKAVLDYELLNWAVQLTYDGLILYYGGYKSLAYLLLSLWLGLGIHPSSGHFISDHYVWEEGAADTSSYYGPINKVTFNVGFHNEHHDFPYVASSRLPLVRKLAPEFYTETTEHKSIIALMYRFITDPTIGLRSRTKRTMVNSNPQQEYYDEKGNRITIALEKLLGYRKTFGEVDLVKSQ